MSTGGLNQPEWSPCIFLWVNQPLVDGKEILGAADHELVVEEDPLDGDLRGGRTIPVSLAALLAVHEQYVQLLVLGRVTFNMWQLNWVQGGPRGLWI